MEIVLFVGFALLLYFAKIYAEAKYEENNMLKNELKGIREETEKTNYIRYADPEPVKKEYTEAEQKTFEMLKQYYWLLESYHTLGMISEEQYQKEGSWLETQVDGLDPFFHYKAEIRL